MFPTNSERLIGISDAFSAFVYGYPSSCARAHCTPNKSVPTLRYTRRPGPIYTGHACRHLPSAVPWISEDRLLVFNAQSTTTVISGRNGYRQSSRRRRRTETTKNCSSSWREQKHISRSMYARAQTQKKKSETSPIFKQRRKIGRRITNKLKEIGRLLVDVQGKIDN